MINVYAICFPSPFSLLVIHREIKFLHLQNKEKSILDWNTVRYFFSWLSWGHTFLRGRRSHKLGSAPDAGVFFWFRSKSLGSIQISSWEMAGFAFSDSFGCFQYSIPTCKGTVLRTDSTKLNTMNQYFPSFHFLKIFLFNYELTCSYQSANLPT